MPVRVCHDELMALQADTKRRRTGAVDEADPHPFSAADAQGCRASGESTVDEIAGIGRAIAAIHHPRPHAAHHAAGLAELSEGGFGCGRQPIVENQDVLPVDHRVMGGLDRIHDKRADEATVHLQAVMGVVEIRPRSVGNELVQE